MGRVPAISGKASSSLSGWNMPTYVVPSPRSAAWSIIWVAAMAASISPWSLPSYSRFQETAGS